MSAFDKLRLNGCALLACVALASCQKTESPARAFQIQSRAELIGGKRALAEVGDFKITNGLVHAIVQGVGFSRGFGAFGGSLIDVDLVRNNVVDPAIGATGNDFFTEMFPAFFLQAIEPSDVKVLSDGSDGSAASIRVSGRGNVFVSLTKTITDVVIPTQPLDYTVDYILAPGKKYIKIVVTLNNAGPDTAQFPLTIPFGFVTLLGEGQRLFVPGGAGFDMRYYLEDVVYKQASALDALPGVVTPMWATEGAGVSYALVSGKQADGSYLENKPDYYPTAGSDSQLIPIAYSSFLGSYWAKSPKEIPKGGSYSYTGYLAVGSGDVASVQEIAYNIHDSIPRPNGKEFVVREKIALGHISGTVRETPTQRPLEGISVTIEDDKGNVVSQARTLKDGSYNAPVPPGNYRAWAIDHVRPLVKSDDFVAVEAEGGARIDLTLQQPGDLQVIVRDEQGRSLPAKVSVEAIYDNPDSQLPRRLLYNLKVGDRYRISDFVPDQPDDPNTRRYLEEILFAGNGTTGTQLRPGKYRIFASRGIEYDLQSKEVEVKAGQLSIAALTLKQVMPTPGWVSADFHVHSLKSPDSDMELDARVTSYAVEGVDFLTSTDHNHVTDLQPTIEALSLSDWTRAAVGLELTSLEMGHFNAFPLLVQPGPVTHGSFRWFQRPPAELFAQLRGLGKEPQKTIVQVNHPRDSILGYFNAFNINTYTGTAFPVKCGGAAAGTKCADGLGFILDASPLADGSKSPYHPENFSLDFDALEVFNGKRPDVMFTYRMPTTPLPGPEPSIPKCGVGGPTTSDCLPAPGEVLNKVITVKEADGSTHYEQQPAFPGALDDWYTLLAQGRKFTATGNSDSHSAHAEAGLPRTYLKIGSTADGSMRSLDEGKVFDALRTGQAIATNGPFFDVTVNGQGPGKTVVASDGKIELAVKVQAAPWVDVTRMVIRLGGKTQGRFPAILDTVPIEPTDQVLRLDFKRSYENVADGSFIVVEVYGDKPMWPVFTPYEVPSVQIADAVSVIGGAFGFGNKFGKYQPPLALQVTPFGFSNPIFVNRTAQQPLTAAKKILPVSNSEPFTPRRIPDLRKLFQALHADP